MKKTNNYIKYLLTLILLGSINVYAQTTGDLSQLLSQAGKELSTLSLSSSSPINSESFAEIIKQNINIFGHFFLDYALPFLFVFGVLTYLAWESRKEINRPLLLIFFIITIITTIYFHSILKIIALGFGVILLIVGIYKIFHGIAKSVLALIVGIIILIVLLTNNIEFLLSAVFFIFLFILFIILFIYSVEVKNKLPHSNEIKKLIHHIHKPEDIKDFENQVNTYITNFRNKAISIEQTLNNIQTKLGEFDSLLNQRQSLQQLRRQIQQILNRLQQSLPQQLQGQIQNLIQSPLRQISQKQIRQIISQLRQIKQQLPRKHQQYIRQLINLLNQLRQQKQLLKRLKKLKREIKTLLKDYDKRYRNFNDDYNHIVNFVTAAITNFQQNYNGPKSQEIIRFLTNKINELKSIKRDIDHKHMMILHNPYAQKLINNYILK